MLSMSKCLRKKQTTTDYTEAGKVTVLAPLSPVTYTRYDSEVKTVLRQNSTREACFLLQLFKTGLDYCYKIHITFYVL